MPPDPRYIEVPTPVGVVVRGEVWGRGPDLALLLHEPGEDLDCWDTLPRRLAGDGLTVAAMDLPGHGLSDGPWQPDALGDALRAVLASQAPAPGKVIIVAAGLTATLVLREPELPPVAGVVALSPAAAPSEGDGARRWPSRPKLIVAGAADDAALAAARQVSKQALGWSMVSSFPTAVQGTELLESAWSSQVIEQVQGFIRTCRFGQPLR